MTAAGDNTSGATGLRLGSLVELTRTIAEQAESAGLSTRGEVTGFLAVPDEPTEIAVRCPGDTRSHPFLADELRPAPAFRELLTYQGLVSAPLAAERCLIRATARITAADHRDLPPRHEDIQDHHDLLTALSNWCGLPPEEFAELVLPKVTNRLREREHDLDPWRGLRRTYATPPAPQVAAADFPISITRGLPPPPPPQRPGGPGSAPGRPAPGSRPAAD